jgi:hypothetical protein
LAKEGKRDLKTNSGSGNSSKVAAKAVGGELYSCNVPIPTSVLTMELMH